MIGVSDVRDELVQWWERGEGDKRDSPVTHCLGDVVSWQKAWKPGLTAAGGAGAAGAGAVAGSSGSHHSGSCRTGCESAKDLNEVVEPSRKWAA